MTRLAKRFFTSWAAVIALTLLAACAATDAPPPAQQGQAEPPAPQAPPPPLSNAPEEVAFRAEAAGALDRGLPILIQRRSLREGRFNVAFYNVSGRVISNISFDLVPYDASGRRVAPPRTVPFTGPVQVSRSLMDGQLEGSQEGLWSGQPGIGCVEITGLDLTYANGERRRYSFDTVSRMYREGVEKWCRFAP